LTYSGWFTHISGHPSATGRAQDSESTPAKDRCYTAGPRNQLRGPSATWLPCISALGLQDGGRAAAHSAQWHSSFIPFLCQLFSRHDVGQALQKCCYCDIAFLL